MAVTTEFERPQRRAGPAGLGIVVAGDRSRDFARARRHSLLVRLLRVGLPLASLVLVAGYLVILLKTVGFGARIAGLPIPRISAENLTMDNPHYEGFNKDGGRYVVSADTAQQDFANPNVIKLKGIKGTLFQPDATRTNLTSVSGVFDNKANRLDLAERIKVVSSNGLTADMTQATVMVKASTMTSSEPVKVTMPSGTVAARTMSLDNKTRKVAFVGDVRTHIPAQQASTPGKAASPADAVAQAGSPSGAAAKTSAKPAKAAPSAGLGTTSGAPLDVASERLDIDDLAATALFSGSVQAVQGDSTVLSDRMLVSYERAPQGAKAAAPEAAPAASPAPAPPAPASATTGKVKQITIDTPVTMMRAGGDKVTAAHADVDVLRQLTILQGQVVITAPPDRRVTSDRAEVDDQNNTILLTGAVHVTQGRNELRGRRILVDRAAKRTHVTSPAEGGGPAGHVTARLYQNKPDTAGTSRKPAKPAQAENAAGAGFASFKTDPNAPINVDSEALDIDDVAHKAIFRVAVHATQGELSINCDELTALYTGSTGLLPGGPAAEPGKGSSQLTKLEARRRVVVTSAKGQKATGDWADFDPKTNTAIMGGNVVLTENGNVVTGTRLHIDMNTGLSNIETAPGETAGLAQSIAKKPPKTATGAEAPQPQFKAGRPSAVFYRQQAKDAAAKVKGAVGSSWQSTTTPSQGSGGN